MIKNLFFGLISIAVLILLSFVGIALINYLRSPLVGDYETLAKNIDKMNFKPVTLSTGTGLSMIGDEVSYYKSTLFPYEGIEITGAYQSDLKCDSGNNVYVYEDSLWHVFWIRTFDCGFSLRNGKMFGPFRSQKPLPF